MCARRCSRAGDGAGVGLSSNQGATFNQATSSSGGHSHTVSGTCTGTCTGTATGTCTGTSDASGASTESRPSNVNVVYCCLALPSAAAAGALGTNGLQYLYNTATADADPGTGNLCFDNASPALATKIFISKTDAVNTLQTVNLTGIFGSASSTKGTVLINQVGSQGNAFSCLVTAIDTSPANYIRLTVSNVVSATGFTATGVTLGVQTSRTGDPGSQGSKGALAVANGLNSNLVPPANSSLRLTGPTAAFSVGGFTTGVDGQQLRIYNTVAQTMTLVNEDASSTAGNRIKTLTGSNIVLRAAATSFATLEYDGTDLRWIVVNTN